MKKLTFLIFSLFIFGCSGPATIDVEQDDTADDVDVEAVEDTDVNIEDVDTEESDTEDFAYPPGPLEEDEETYYVTTDVADTISYLGFTFTWPEDWDLVGQRDENTWEILFENGDLSCTSFFSLVARLDKDYKQKTDFTNNDGDIEITEEGAPSGNSAYEYSEIAYAYGLWVDDIMYFANISSYCSKRDFDDLLEREVLEEFLAGFSIE